MQRKFVVIGLALIAVVGALGSSAFTSATLDRNANVDVVNDGNGLIALEDGNSGDIVYQNGSGALAIDFAQGSATGVNVGATFELGNPDKGNITTAFNLTNHDSGARDVTLSYAAAADNDPDANIEFQVYNGDGTLAATASENSGATVNLASGGQRYVVVVVNTHGMDAASDDLSGTLTVSAS